jgi:CTP:molybdopterin cytidylyltransferase MocA
MTAIVLAGQRAGEDELARHANAACKAVVKIAGKPMLERVLETLMSSSSIQSIIVSGPNREKLADQNNINELIQAGHAAWLPPQTSPSRSAYAVLRKLQPDEQVLMTTADHPLLSPKIVDEFCSRSIEQDADLTVGLAPYALVHDKFPAMKKTVLRFKGAELCGCNLFTFLTPAGRDAANYWRRVESQRKSPLRVIRSLGWITIAKYFFGVLTLDDALRTLSRKMGLRIRAIILPYADAAVDVDSVSDYCLVQAAFESRTEDAEVS